MNKSILTVDPDPDVLAFLTLLFEPHDVRVLRARTRSEAFEIMNREYVPVDLVLVNLILAQTEAPELSHDVASVRPGVPVVYMSAFVDSGIIRIEALKLMNDSGLSAVDERGVIDMVLATLATPHARASGKS